ncbi:MAG: pectinesterase family protein [Candidatus Thermoplasmatota archaeon]
MKGKVVTAIIFTIFFLSAETMISSHGASKHTEIENKMELNSKQTITVDQTGNGDYTKIQKAIDAAEKNDIISVKNGYYNETIKIDKTITLIGENKTNTIVNPISKKNKYAIRLGAQNIKIQNLGITNRAPGHYTSAVRISSNNIEIQNCNIYNTPIGVATWTPNNRIENCTFWNCKDEAIALLGSKNNICSQNIINNCTFYDNCDAIELQYSKENIIKNCRIYNNTHTGINAIASNNDQNLIYNCEIYNNEVHGIYFFSSSDNKIQNCNIYNNKDGDLINRENSQNNIVSSKETASFQPSSKNIELTNMLKDKIVDFLSLLQNLFLKKNY